MKKLVLLVMALCLVLGLAACAQPAPAAKEPAKAEPTKEAAAPVAAEPAKTEPTKEAAAPAAEKKALKVALLVGNLGDMSFNDSAASGLNKAKAELGVQGDVIEYGSDPNKFEATILDAAEQGYDMVLASTTMQGFIESHADEFPKTTFVLFDGQVDWTKGKYANVYCIQYKANEASYLGGFVASSISKSKVIGFLGGTDQPIINDFLLGYIAGALQANKDTKIITTYVGSYTDSPKGKELSLGMFNQKADIAFNVAGGSGVGLIEAAADTGNMVLGVDSDQAMIYKAKNNMKFAEVIPTSVLKNVGASLFRAIELFQKGELPLGKAENLGIKEGGVGLADNEFYQKMVPEDVRTQVKALMEKILNGEIVIDSAIGKDTAEIAKIRDSVKP
ncbi:MAG: BMP family ABC transporter substrate-binding protein [Anaerolineaceae bacterium]|nr:BMP family ABC transporter substrate-binding protein [Anaerolineaceae bacterium]